MSKILVSCQGTTPDDQVDPRFGRAANYILIDSETLEYELIDNNSAKSMAGGAGIQAAETVVNSGAQVVLSGFVGPKAFAGLDAAGIVIGQGVDGMTVREAVERYKAGKVEIASKASKPGHWG